jgi:hypothetical protein
MTTVDTRQDVLIAGSTRRIQALIARGFTYGQLGEYLAMAPGVLRDVAALGGGRIDSYTHDEIARVYDYIECDDPPAGTPNLKENRHARTSGWIPPEMWSGLDIDDPHAFPDGRATSLELLLAEQAVRCGSRGEAAKLLPRMEDRARLAHDMRMRGAPLELIGRIGGNVERASYAEYLLLIHARALSLKAEAAAGIPVRLIAVGHHDITTEQHMSAVWRALALAVGEHRSIERVIHTDEPGFPQVVSLIARRAFGWDTELRPVDWSAECIAECPRYENGKSRHWQNGRCSMTAHYRTRGIIEQAAKDQADGKVLPVVVGMHMSKCLSRVTRAVNMSRDLGVRAYSMSILGGDGRARMQYGTE